MSSLSLQKWLTERAEALDQIEGAHQALGGPGPGRRYAMDQLNHAYAALLSSHFQGFCRDLHTECVEQVLAITPAHVEDVLSLQFLWGRALDKGNPNAGNIGSDFGRFRLAFWSQVEADFANNDRRKIMLQELNDWRNAIVHQDFDVTKLGSAALPLKKIKGWRRALNRLALSFDNVMQSRLQVLLGTSPWKQE
jgi:hypothetical protein